MRQESIRRIAKDMQVSELGHVAIVVDPFRQNLCSVQRQGLGIVMLDRAAKGCFAQLLFIGGKCLPCPPWFDFERLQNADEIVVSDAF